MTTIVKATSKGQITLPAKWRKLFDTNQYIIKEKKGALEIRPIDMDMLEKQEEWTVVFNAVRDNGGKGVPAEQFIKMLEELIKEDYGQAKKAS